ncbi:MAG TPA: redoxin domain-containing protein [Thermoanaerobaculia bacterium]|jgi:peroxiredoxin|nr:redoxin domain-containing protein [Thermoanaerobaculia bacterium]
MRLLRSALVLAGLCALACNAVAEAPAIGAMAPDFQLTTIDGKAFSLSSAAKDHKAVVLMFISTQCPYSNAYNGQMKDLANAFASKGVLFAGINSNKSEDAAAAVAHAKAHGHTFPIMKDPSNKVADMYDARRTPEVYVIDSQGKLRYHGRITENHEDPASSPDLKNALDSFLAGKPIARTETKAFGCTIKRV